VAWDPRRIRQFLTGVITLGELEGISKQEQYEMAKAGHRHFKQGKLDSARKIFEGLVALDPRDAYFHMTLGAIAQRDNHLAEAEKCYTRALEINPYSAHALANRGEVRMLTGHMADGTKDLLRALEEDPGCKEEATKRARATINMVITQLQEAGISVSPPSPKAKKPRSKKGPVKKSRSTR